MIAITLKSLSSESYGGVLIIGLVLLSYGFCNDYNTLASTTLILVVG